MARHSPAPYDSSWVGLWVSSSITDEVVARELSPGGGRPEAVTRTTAIRCPRVGGRRECCIFALSRVGWAR